MLILTFNDNEEKAIEKVIAALANEIEFEVVRSVSTPMLSFSGLEIRQHQRRVLRNGKDIKLTRLEFGTLVFLASSPNRVFTQSQIFEAVWNMDSDSCQSSVVNVIYNLRKKIEPDSKNPTYLKTVLGIGYKFSADSIGE
jgi:DNA-binding response OmpR family regulator